MHDFLAADFARLDADVLRRCMCIDGERLYLAGASGFFGKNLLALLAYLRSRGASFTVTALSRAPERLFAEHPWCKAPWIEWRRGDALDAWPGDGDYSLLIHAATDTAATAHVDLRKVFDDIVTTSRRALDFSAAHKVRRVLLCGSGAQYGAAGNSRADDLVESSLACDPTQPASAYGEGKRVGELLAALYAREHRFAVINSRGFAFVGPGLPLDGHFAIGNFIRDAIAGDAIRLTSAGRAVRSYLYGADLAVWLMVLLLEATPGAAINVGSDSRVRIADLARRVRDLVNPDIPVILGDGLQRERQVYVPSITAARALGLAAWTDLDDAITRTAAWHRRRGVGHAAP